MSDIPNNNNGSSSIAEKRAISSISDHQAPVSVKDDHGEVVADDCNETTNCDSGNAEEAGGSPSSSSPSSSSSFRTALQEHAGSL
jgi:hypothetical protein